MRRVLLKAPVPHPVANPARVVKRTLDQSPGESLDAGTIRFMGSRLGHDFSRVRVHRDSPAISATHAFSARAFTTGSHVFFDSGEYRPDTREGRQVLAHELTHVIQQHGASPRGMLPVASRNDNGEQDASRSADAVTSGRGAGQSHPGAALQIQRLPRGDDDPIHRPILDQYRSERGIPLSGRDESGAPVGPSDAEIKYGQRVFTSQVTVPAPPERTVPAPQTSTVAQQAAPTRVSVATEPAAPQPAPVPATPAARSTSAIQPLAREPVRFGLDVTGDTTEFLSATAMPRHLDALRFRLFGIPIDLGHEPAGTVGVSLNPATFGVVSAGIGGTILNAHFAAFGYDFLELALGQGGISLDTNGAVTIIGGAGLEIHSRNPHFSIGISSSGSVVRNSNGSVTTSFSPLNFSLIVHILNP